MIGGFDTERLKASVDLRELFGRRVELRSETTGGREQSGPCPKCGGDDRLHVTADWFFCRECHSKRGDAIEAVQFLGLAADFRAACEYLGGGSAVTSSPSAGPVVKRTPAAKSKAAGWQDATWQNDARGQLSQAQAALFAPEGEPGRAYLTARGLLPDTWRAWGLGYTPAAWDPKLSARRPAIVLPWQRDRITALKYRFLTVPEGGLRYSSKGGSECIAFGLGLAGAHFVTLWLLEGELNALSLWQALRAAHFVNVDVASFGSDSKALDDKVTSWAARYRQVIVWADKPDKAAAAMQAIPGAFGLRSPKPDGRELDANELLKLGILADFARAAWNGFDSDPAYLARVRAELDELGAA